MPTIDESAVLAADILSEIVQYIYSSQPVRTDGTRTQGVNVQFQRPGRMVSPRDFGYPWSPVSGSDGPGGGDSDDAAEKKEIFERSVKATLNTDMLMDTRFVVTDDGTLGTYSGGGKEVSSTYIDLLASMEALPLPERPKEEVERIAKAQAVLWDEDMEPTEAYQRYLDNQLEYSQAQGNYTTQSVILTSDPSTVEVAPMLLRPYLTEVDQAWHKWKSQGAEQVEAALATVESLGVPLQQGAIAKARERLSAWTIPLPNLAAELPYTFALPSDWPLSDVRDIGWTKLTRTAQQTRTRHHAFGYDLGYGQQSQNTSHVDSNVSVGVAKLYSVGGSYNRDHSGSQSSGGGVSVDIDNSFTRVKDIKIELEYGIVQILRPWARWDLFAMHGWFLRGQKAGAISKGTIEGQVRDEVPLLPCIPTGLLVIRNVKITASDWGETRKHLEDAWHAESASQSTDSSSGKVSGSGIFTVFSLSGGANGSRNKSRSQFRNESGKLVDDAYGAYFKGNTLTIDGAQIVAVLNEVIPLAPLVSDPSLPADDAAGGGDAVAAPPSGGQPIPAPPTGPAAPPVRSATPVGS